MKIFCTFFRFYLFNSKKYCTFAANLKIEQMTNRLFSFYLPPHFFYVDEAGKIKFASMTPAKSVNVQTLFEYIKHDQAAAEMTRRLRDLSTDEEVLRHVPEKDDAGHWHAKQIGTQPFKVQFKNTRFAFVQFAGVFSYRRGDALQAPSGLWCVDFDHFARTPEELAQAKDALLADDQARPVLVFTSPSGDGLKAIYLFDFLTDEAERVARLRGLYAYLKSRFPNWKQIDGKHAGEHALDTYTDAPHCCNVPHDADARLNEDAFTRLDWTFWRVEPERQTSSTFVASTSDEEKCLWYVNELVSSGVDVTDGMTFQDFVGLAHAFTGLANGEELFLRLSSLWPNYREADARQTFRLAQRQTSKTDVSHFFKIAIEALHGRTWEKYSIKGQEAVEAWKQKQREDWLSTHKKGQMKTEQQQAPVVQDLEQPAAALNEEQLLTDDELRRIVLERPTLTDFVGKAATVAVSVPTNFVFGYGSEREPFTLKSQALTVIGAGTSHGKTRFLENVLLDVAAHDTQDTSGTCLFFTLEECFADVVAELVNVHANVQTVRTPEDGTQYTNNLTAYADAFKRLALAQTAGTDAAKLADAKRFFKNDAEFAQAHKAIQKFFDDFVNSGKIQIFDDEMFRDVHTFCTACRTYAAEHKLKAVFVDHLGMMTEHGVSSSVAKTERVERIVTELEQLAKELNVPFVVTQQLARRATSALKLDNADLADSVDVERSANTVVLLWNSSVLPLAEYSEKDLVKRAAIGILNTPAEYSEHGFIYGVRGSLLAKLTKRRGGIRDVWTVLDFNGQTGKIQMMTPERLQDIQTRAAQMKDAAAIKNLRPGEVHTNHDGTTSALARNSKGKFATVATSQPGAEPKLTAEQYDAVLNDENVRRLDAALNGDDNSLHDTDQFADNGGRPF